MDMDQFRCVLAVVDNKTFLEAAEALNFSQSSVSKNIQKLEKELGISLFQRTTRRVELTEAGAEMVPNMRQILAEEEALLKKAKYYQSATSGQLRVGSIYFGKNNRLVPLVAEFMKAYPNVDVTLEESTTTPLVNALLSHSLDVVFVSSMYLQNSEGSNYSGDDRFHSISFSRDPYYVLVSQDSPLAKKKILDYTDLDGQNLITTDQTMDVYHTAIKKTFDQYGVNVNVRTHCTNVRSVLHMVAQNVGIAILSRLVIEEMDNMVMIPLTNPLIRDTQMLVIKQKEGSPQIRQFFRFVKKSIYSDLE